MNNQQLREYGQAVQTWANADLTIVVRTYEKALAHKDAIIAALQAQAAKPTPQAVGLGVDIIE